MPTLRPDRLVDLPSGLWAVDEVQPVAAVLDRPPLGARRRRLTGAAAAAWTDGSLSAACGPSTAWCAPRSPG